MSRDGGEDGWTSEYDSTWEDEEEEDGRKEEKDREPRTQPRHNYPRRWRNRAARDLQFYRHGYRGELSSDQPCMGENSRAMPNLDFYQNKKCFDPNGLYIEELLSEWKEDYNTLERNHSYIQWLFPLREFGMNSYAKPLTLHEIQMMTEDKAVMARFLEAYELMLGFYGIKLLNKETGEVARAENWEDRFKNLNYHSHNNLRITRILKCLGEMRYNHFQAPLVKFFLEETLLRDKLPNVKRSVLDYFMFAVKDKHERRKLVHFAWENYKSNNHQDKFIWGPVEKLKRFHLQEENAMNAGSEELRDDVEKNTVSKTYKNHGKEFIKFSESSRARVEKVMANQHGSKVEKATVNELIPMKARGAFPENSPNHNTETSPDQSTPLSKHSNSIIGIEKDNMEEMKHVEKKESVDYEDAKEDSSIEDLTKKVHKDEVIKKIENDQDGALEFNGLSNCGDIQNENKHHLGEHQRKRKMPVHSPISPLADGCASGDGTQSSHNSSPSRAIDEAGQVEGVEDKVKKLKLVERAATDCPNGREENNYPHDTTSGDKGDNSVLPLIECTLNEHSEGDHKDE